MNNSRWQWAMVLVASAAMATAPAHGGALFLAGQMKDGQFVPDKTVTGPCYTVRYSTIDARIDDRGAETTVRETIVGPAEGTTRTVCLVPLPVKVDPASVRITAGAPQGEPRDVPARALSVEQARELYQAIAKATGSVAIVSLSGRPALLVERFDLPSKVEVALTYRQAVGEDAGVRFFECPMPSAAWSRGAVARLALTATVTSGKALRAMFSPSQNAGIERDGLRKAVVRVKADEWSGRDDFRLCYVADDDDLGLRLLAYRPEETEDGYFLLIGNPSGSVRRREALPKDVLFVLDTSGSMRGEKIEQARAAIEYCLGQLNEHDRFNIITFGTDVRAFREAPADRAKASVAAAQEFIEAAVARGRTNISGALARGLAGAPVPGRLRIMIFLTDGTPTAGEIVPEKIVEKLGGMNTSQTRVFVLGVGHDVNAHLLDKLAEQTDGSCEYADPDEEIDVKVAALYDRLSNPVLNHVAVAFGSLRPTAVFPGKLPALFTGTEIMVAGRYHKAGEQTVALSGTLAGKPVSYTCRADFPARTDGRGHEFVAPLWAARKIGYLLREIRLHGGNKELIEEVVRLSTKFGIVTEYTEFLASGAAGGGPADEEAAVKLATGHLRAARAQESGQWAVNQAVNELSLQKRVVATAEANLYRDRRGNVVANDNVRQIGDRAFYLRDGQWMDASDAGGQKARRVKLFSEEYFELLRKDADFARAQRLGWNVEMNVGKERIAVEKDGKVQDEALRERARQMQKEQQQEQQQLDQRNGRQNQLNLNQQQIDPKLLQQLQQIRQQRDERRQAPAEEQKPEQKPPAK